MYAEKWAKVDVGGYYDGLYEISNLGRFKMLPRIVNTGRLEKGYFRRLKEKITIGSLSHGYRVVQLKKDRVKKLVGVHQLVAIAFIPNQDNLPVVNHINAIRGDNRVENLEWCTHAGNVRHTIKLGRLHAAKGEKNGSAKLNDVKVRAIRKLYSTGEFSSYDLSNVFDIDSRQISRIVKYEQWKHVQ